MERISNISEIKTIEIDLSNPIRIRFLNELKHICPQLFGGGRLRSDSSETFAIDEPNFKNYDTPPILVMKPIILVGRVSMVVIWNI